MLPCASAGMDNVFLVSLLADPTILIYWRNGSAMPPSNCRIKFKIIQTSYVLHCSTILCSFKKSTNCRNTLRSFQHLLTLPHPHAQNFQDLKHTVYRGVVLLVCIFYERSLPASWQYGDMLYASVYLTMSRWQSVCSCLDTLNLVHRAEYKEWGECLHIKWHISATGVKLGFKCMYSERCWTIAVSGLRSHKCLYFVPSKSSTNKSIFFPGYSFCGSLKPKWMSSLRWEQRTRKLHCKHNGCDETDQTVYQSKGSGGSGLSRPYILHSVNHLTPQDLGAAPGALPRLTLQKPQELRSGTGVLGKNVNAVNARGFTAMEKEWQMPPGNIHRLPIETLQCSEELMRQFSVQKSPTPRGKCLKR